MSVKSTYFVIAAMALTFPNFQSMLQLVLKFCAKQISKIPFSIASDRHTI